MNALPQYIDAELWVAFIEMRKSHKKVPFTDYAKKLILKELMKFHSEGYDANNSLEQAIMKGWRGVFRGELRAVTKKEIDPVLVKLSEDSKKAAPCPPELKAKLDALKRGVFL